jgi:hypothetical protein
LCACVAPAGDDLEDKDAVAEDVGLGREYAVQGVLRRHVAAAIFRRQGTLDTNTHRATPRNSLEASSAESLLRSGNTARVPDARVHVEQLRQSEVGDLGVHVLVQQDIAGLEVPVDDRQPRVFVEIEEPPTDPLDDLVPLPPAQHLLPRRICENTVFFSKV